MADIRDIATHQEVKRKMIEALKEVCKEYDVQYYEILDGVEFKLAYTYGLKMFIQLNEIRI